MTRTLTLDFKSGNIQEITRLIREDIENKFQSSHEIGAYSVGVEHEMFLFNSDDQCCTLSESQSFLARLSQSKGWKVFETSEAGHICRVSKDQANGNYFSVKYEHPPYLLEIATAPFPTVELLAEHFKPIWECLQRTADNCSLKIHSVPFIQPPQIDWVNEVDPISTKFRTLSTSRMNHCTDLADTIKSTYVDFPTYMAATQVHIGGKRWWTPKGEKNIALLQLSELNRINSLSKNSSHPDWIRHQIYDQIFSHFPLAPFALTSNWSFERWIRCLCESQEQNEKFTTLSELTQLLRNTRDLQSVRPKLFGTMEFRMDHARASFDQIIELASIRMNQVKELSDGD